MRGLLYILLVFAFTAAAAQPVQAPLQTFITGGAATGAVHPSTTIPTHFSSFGQPMLLPRTENTQNGSGMGMASEIMFAVDDAPPLVISRSPATNDTGVAVDAPLILVFNEPIVKSTGNIFIRRMSDNHTLKTLDVASASVIISDKTLTITHTDIPPNTEVYVIIPNTAVRDESSNYFVGYIDATGWKYTTGDDGSTPEVISRLPAMNEVDVNTNTNLVLDFDEPIMKNGGDILVYLQSNNDLLETISINSGNVILSGSTLIIELLNDLPSNSDIYVIIPLAGILDLYANAFAGYPDATGWKFNTGITSDIQDPFITTMVPNDDAINVVVTSSLFFTCNEPVFKGEGLISIRRTDDNTPVDEINVNSEEVFVSGNEVTVDIGTLPFGTNLYVDVPVGAFVDASGNSSVGTGTVAWSFRTEDSESEPPFVEALNPAMDETGVGINTDLIITFNETIEKNTGNILIRRVSGDVTEQTIDVATGAVVSSGSTLTVTLNDLPTDTELYVVIPNTAIRDVNGNNFAGYTDATGWKFTTGSTSDTQGPVITGLAPADGDASVDVNSSLSITFDEQPFKGTGLILIRKSDDTLVEEIDVTSAEVVISGNSVTINASTFPDETGLYVLVPSGAFEDAIGNLGDGISATSDWNFTTAADQVAPLVKSFAPVDGYEGVLVTAVLTIEFNESIQKGTGLGAIEIKRTPSETVKTISLDTDVVIDGAFATINPPGDLPWNESLYVSIPPGSLMDLAGNDFAGIIDVTTWNFVVQQDLSGPVISPSPLPGAIEMSQAIPISATINDPHSGVSGAYIQYRMLGSASWQPIKNLVPSGLVWTETIDASFAVESGVEYIITATNNAGAVTTFGPALVKISPGDNGLVIPYSSWGSKQQNFRIVAVPLDLNNRSVTAVFDDDLEKKNKNWRLARYENNNTNQNYSGSIEAGEGYWLIVKKDPGHEIDTGPGSTVQALSPGGKGISLTQGWNQIGNPYNFPISWAEVQVANPGLGGLRIYEGTYRDGTGLNTMEGGFVNNTGGVGTIQIPPKKDPAAGRTLATTGLRNPIDKPDWEVYLNLEQGDMQNLISGVGMRAHASAGIDEFDGLNMPRFDEYLEVSHYEAWNDFTFSKDIVPTNADFVWDFSVVTSLVEEDMSFTWDNSYFGANGKEIVLWDEDLQRPVDMKLNSGYQFDRTRTNRFKVVFGDRTFVEENTQVNRLVIHQVSPNPAAKDLSVSLGIPTDELVSIEVHDLLGRRLTTFFEGRLTKGHHEIAWDRSGDEPDGLYIIVAKAGEQVATARVILK